MVPLVGFKKELDNQVAVIHEAAAAVQKETGQKISYLVGTMIEIPRGALTADEIAETAEFFTYNGEGFQETELTRVPGLGFDWLLTSYMGTVIHEHQDGAASGKNNRMVKLTGVRS